MPTVLSTKILTASQKELLLNGGVSFVEYDALKIECKKFDLSQNFEYIIFTSQNAIKSYTKYKKIDNSNKINALCVGKKSKSLLEKYGFNVIENADNARQLANIIVEKYKKSTFLFLCGNHRRNELPNILKKYNVQYKEIEVYETYQVFKKFKRQFDGVLFFSPSGVESFIKKNELNRASAFCIGETTATEAKKYTDKIIIANTPTIENVIVQVVKKISS